MILSLILKTRVCARVVVACLVVCLVGCGGSTGVPVTGKVLLDGKPITLGKGMTASVTYHADKSKGNDSAITAVGPVTDSGEYTLSAAPGKTGVPAGWYKVTVSYTKPSDPKNEYAVPVSVISPAFNTPEQTPLSIEVKAGAAADAYNLPVKK